MFGGSHGVGRRRAGRGRTVVGQDLAWFKAGKGEWERCVAALDDAEQSLILSEYDASSESAGAPLLVAGLHEASVDVVLETAGEKARDVGSTTSICLTLQNENPDESSASELLLRLENPGRIVSWVANLKRASFPPGRLWAANDQQCIDEYAMSQFTCVKVGTVWKAESAKVGVLIDSLRLCSNNSLMDQMCSSPESALLLLRLKAFGCTLSIDRVVAEYPWAAEEVDALLCTSLRELLEFVNACAQPSGSFFRRLDETAFCDLVEMVALRLLRPIVGAPARSAAGSEPLPPALVGPQPVPATAESGAFKFGEGSEAAWRQHALLYELLLKLVGGNLCDAELKKRCVSEQFCRDFCQLFRSKDPREREYVKTVAHCMYSRLVSHRGAMRQAISHAFIDFSFSIRQHVGVVELLEVVGSIASGFAKPIKQEHVNMLRHSLLPLLSVRGCEGFMEQLSFVLVQYISKEPDLAVSVMEALLRYWPRRSAAKQIIFLGEVGEIVSFMEPVHFEQIQARLVRQLCECISGPHFQVAEYAMGLLNNSSIYAMIFENPSTRHAVLPALLLALRQASRSWNASVKQIGSDIIDFLRTLDFDFFVVCERHCVKLEVERARRAQVVAKMEAELIQSVYGVSVDPVTLSSALTQGGFKTMNGVSADEDDGEENIEDGEDDDGEDDDDDDDVERADDSKSEMGDSHYDESKDEAETEDLFFGPDPATETEIEPTHQLEEQEKSDVSQREEEPRAATPSTPSKKLSSENIHKKSKEVTLCSPTSSKQKPTAASLDEERKSVNKLAMLGSMESVAQGSAPGPIMCTAAAAAAASMYNNQSDEHFQEVASEDDSIGRPL